jgi:monoamine oxidase
MIHSCTSEPQTPLNIAIVGAGTAALKAAETLLSHPQSVIGSVTILEALSYVGGRIKSDDSFLPDGHRLDLGAEYIHGFGTMLTDIVQEKKPQWEEERLGPDEELLEETFIVAHADGGPQKFPTKDGKYGVYYLAQEDTLLRFDSEDKDFCQLNEALGSLEWECGDGVDAHRVDQSLGSYLEENVSVPPRMNGILEAGFGNTAGCSNLHKISLSATIDFEKHWEENEEAGDARLNSRIGMIGIIEAQREKIEKDERCKIHLEWKVMEISWEEGSGANIFSVDGRHIFADKVILTIPPSIITKGDIKFNPPLPTWKTKAFGMVGMERAIKVISKFTKRLWPENVQSVIAGDMPIPEMWFREMKVKAKDVVQSSTYIAVGFLTSKAADDFVGMLNKDSTRLESKEEIAANILKEQLSKIFKVNRSNIEEAYESSIMFDWGDVDTIRGGYVYPKVGITKDHFRQMGQSLGDVLYFAGEATNTGACCTVQAAMETGKRVANEILEVDVTISSCERYEERQ